LAEQINLLIRNQSALRYAADFTTTDDEDIVLPLRTVDEVEKMEILIDDKKIRSKLVRFVY
jgi:hypothetical protein